MIDLTPIKNYILETKQYYLDEAEVSIGYVGFNAWFENQINMFCNCSRLSKDGHRLIQTNYKHYSYELATIVAMIEKHCDDNKDYYYEKLIERNNTNLEFEAINGFEFKAYDDSKKKKSTTTRKRSTKQTSIEFDDKPKKETAAERKLKAHIAKINKLNINLKPAKHDNTL